MQPGPPRWSGRRSSGRPRSSRRRSATSGCSAACRTAIR